MLANSLRAPRQARSKSPVRFSQTLKQRRCREIRETDASSDDQCRSLGGPNRSRLSDGEGNRRTFRANIPIMGQAEPPSRGRRLFGLFQNLGRDVFRHDLGRTEKRPFLTIVRSCCQLPIDLRQLVSSKDVQRVPPRVSSPTFSAHWPRTPLADRESLESAMR